MGFLDDDFLLHSTAARRLYRDHAEGQPILDYHCHLPARDIANDRRFENLFEIWLEGDHYKWRAMRTAGVDERYCTGDADPYEKFLAWAETVPKTLRNPLYHWTHLELRRYFGITELLDRSTAPGIWARAKERLRDGSLTVRGIFVGSREMFEDMNRAFELNETRPVIDRAFGFDEFPAALRHLESGAHFGKVVVRVG